MITDKYILPIKDVPLSVLYDAEEEYHLIINSKHTNKNSLAGRPRDPDEIKRNVVRGKIGEYILKRYYNYTEDPEVYHDLISPGGVRTEVKTWKKSSVTHERINTQVRALSNKKQDGWFHSTVVIIILFDEKNNEYEIFDVRRI